MSKIGEQTFDQIHANAGSQYPVSYDDCEDQPCLPAIPGSQGDRPVLGADAVLPGRPYMWGLAVGGQGGVEQVIHNLAAETDLTMALCGAARFADIDASMVTRDS